MWNKVWYNEYTVFSERHLLHFRKELVITCNEYQRISHNSKFRLTNSQSFFKWVKKFYWTVIFIALQKVLLNSHLCIAKSSIEQSPLLRCKFLSHSMLLVWPWFYGNTTVYIISLHCKRQTSLIVTMFQLSKGIQQARSLKNKKLMVLNVALNHEGIPWRYSWIFVNSGYSWHYSVVNFTFNALNICM